MSVKRSAFEVGVLVFLGVVLFIAGFVFFKRQQIMARQKTIQFVFDDADGVLVGSTVEFSGVQVGQVDIIRIGSDGRAHVFCDVNKDLRIPRDSEIWVSASVLGGRASIDIMPNHVSPSGKFFADSEPVPGYSPINMALLSRQTNTLMGKAGEFFDHLQTTENKVNSLLDESNRTAASMNGVLNSADLKSTLANFSAAAGQAALLAGDMRKDMASDNALVASSLRNVKGMTGNAEELTQSSRNTLLSSLNNIDQVTGKLNSTVDSVNEILHVTKNAWVEGNAANNMSDAIENLKVASNKLVAIENDLRSVTGDPGVQSDLKTAIHNVAEASGKTNELIARLSGAGSHSSTFSQTEANLVFLEDLRTNNFRTDFDAYLAQGSKTFYRAGVRDITGANHLNFEAGQRYNDGVSMRAGVYNNKVALGADFGLFGRNPLTLDLYDPNVPHLDLRQRIGVGDNAGIWFGMEDIFRSSDYVVGFDLRP